MGDNVRRLALIDAEKFNSLIDLLETNTARQKILDDATRTPEAAGLIESHATAINSVKNKSTLAGTDIINYLRKKDNYQKSVAPPTDEGDTGAVDPPPQPPENTPKVGTIASAEKLINAHFKAKGVLHPPTMELKLAILL
jgi:hypothetical protein